jgi:hypothetical protein
MIVAANHMRDLHVQVIDHYAEVVGGCAVRPRNHQIVELVVRD